MLADFGNEGASAAFDHILDRVIQITEPNLERERIIKQLEVFSRLRNLQELFIKKMETMALTYDIESDIRFKQGEAKGEKIGKAKGSKRRQPKPYLII